jgi:hypothetical protein
MARAHRIRRFAVAHLALASIATLSTACSRRIKLDRPDEVVKAILAGAPAKSP